MQQGPGGVRGEEEGGRGKGEGRLGFWQVAARQRGGVCVEISLGKLCTTLDHGTLRVGIRVSCHISLSTTNEVWDHESSQALSMSFSEVCRPRDSAPCGYDVPKNVPA